MKPTDEKKCALCERIQKAILNSPYNEIEQPLMEIIKNAIFQKEVTTMADLDKEIEKKYLDAQGTDPLGQIYAIFDAVIKSVDVLATRVERLEKGNIGDKPDVVIAPDRAAAEEPLPEKDEGVGENPEPESAPAPVERQPAEKPEEESEGEEMKEEPGDAVDKPVKDGVAKAEALKQRAFEVGKKIGEIEGIKKAVMESKTTTPRPPTAGRTASDRVDEIHKTEAPEIPDNELSKMSFRELNRKLNKIEGLKQ